MCVFFFFCLFVFVFFFFVRDTYSLSLYQEEKDDSKFLETLTTGEGKHLSSA